MELKYFKPFTAIVLFIGIWIWNAPQTQAVSQLEYRAAENVFVRGTEFKVRKTFEIPENDVIVHFQEGRLKDSRALKPHLPYCYISLRDIDEPARRFHEDDRVLTARGILTFSKRKDHLHILFMRNETSPIPRDEYPGQYKRLQEEDEVVSTLFCMSFDRSVLTYKDVKRALGKYFEIRLPTKTE